MSRLKWEDVRAEWPGSSRSDFVDAAGIRWHVQQKAGAAGPELLFIHGSGASCHSWAGVVGALPEDVGWLTLDLPGHAFSRVRGGERPPAGPAGIADALVRLLVRLDVQPRWVVGHSAGAAIGLAVAERTDVEGVLALNPSLTDALNGRLERAVADLVGPVIRSELSARLAAALARRTRLVDTLLDDTGSYVPEWSRRWYRRLFTDPDHVRAVLRLFSEWRPDEVTRTISALAAGAGGGVRVRAVTGPADRWIDEESVCRALAPLGARARVVAVGGGHLAHEESPARTVAEIAAMRDASRD